MTEPLQVGQFAIVDYEPVDRGPNAGVFSGRGPTDDRAELFLLGEGTTPAGESFAGHVVSAAGQAWQTLDISLTGALRRVFSEANDSLRDWNSKSIAQHRVSMGLIAFAHRGAQAVIAQAGPSIAFHRHAEGVTAYVADEEHGQPVGTGANAEPQLTRLDFAPGDRLLMISTGALAELDDELVGGILGLPQAQVLANLYRRVQHLRHVTVVFVTRDEDALSMVNRRETPEFVIGAPAPAAPEVPIGAEQAVAAESYQPSLFINDHSGDVLDAARRQLVEVRVRTRETGADIPAVVTEMPAPLRRAAGDGVLSMLGHDGRPRASVLAATHGAPARAWRSPTPLASASDNSGDPRRRQRRSDSFTRSLVRDEALGPPSVAVEYAPPLQELADEFRARAMVTGPVSQTIATENAVALSNGAALVRVRGGMSGRWKGGGTLSSRHVLSMEKLPPTWLIILCGLGLLLAVVGALTVPRVLDGNGGREYGDLIDNARARLATARAVQDLGEKRNALTEAAALVLQAQEAPGAGPDAADLRKDIEADVAALDNVKAPALVEALSSLEQFGDKPVAITRLAVSETVAYALDSASGQVIALPLDGSVHKVVFGEDKEAKRGRPVAIVYAASEDLGEPSLVILDTARNLWAFSENRGLRPATLRLPEGAQPADITMFGRDLYVLDPAAKAVYRMTPGEGGFTGLIRFGDTKDISNPVRLMVDTDGVVVTDAAGILHRYSGQYSLALRAAGIDQQLVAPEAPFALGATHELAVLDAPNNRIVVLRGDGAFDRQYQHKDFETISSLAFANGGAYVFSGGKLRRVNFE
ncbi:MAG: SpoIIE family protein phosphatase [Dehalococcoidia bacterium]